MAIVRFRPYGLTTDPFRDFSEMQSEVNRLFDSFAGRPTPATGSDRVWVPAADMYETQDHLVITVDLPGLSEKDIHLSITGDMLVIRGEGRSNPEVKPGSYYRGERWVGKFERTLPLPIPVQTDKVKASYRDGVLTVSMPKVEEIKPKEIKIDAA
jgi:HSP20 family protein